MTDTTTNDEHEACWTLTLDPAHDRAAAHAVRCYADALRGRDDARAEDIRAHLDAIARADLLHHGLAFDACTRGLDAAQAYGDKLSAHRVREIQRAIDEIRESRSGSVEQSVTELVELDGRASA